MITELQQAEANEYYACKKCGHRDECTAFALVATDCGGYA